MTTQLKPETAARIAELAERLGYTGPDTTDRILQLAVDNLASKIGLPPGKLTPAEMEEEKKYWAEVGKRNRVLYPFDDSNPPSKFLQDELYDESGLPR